MGLTLHVRIGVRIPDQFRNSPVESCLRLILIKVKGDTKFVPLPQDVHVGEGVVKREMVNVLNLNLQEILTVVPQPETRHETVRGGEGEVSRQHQEVGVS